MILATYLNDVNNRRDNRQILAYFQLIPRGFFVRLGENHAMTEIMGTIVGLLHSG